MYKRQLYYTIAHFSKYIRQDAKRIDFQSTDSELMPTTVMHSDNSLILVVLNQGTETLTFSLQLEDRIAEIVISLQAAQMRIIPA